jgi:hypothetical protein
VPDSVSVLGQTIDLGPIRGLLQPVGDGLSGLIGTVGGLLSKQPDLSFPLPGAAGGERTSTWLLTTYLDDDTRITRCARGGGGGGGGAGRGSAESFGAGAAGQEGPSGLAVLGFMADQG